MIHICKKWNCPRRFSIGSETDSDHLTFLCTECREIYYYSEKRTRTIIIFFRIFFLILLSSIIGYLLWPILTRPSMEDIFDFGITGDSLAVNELIYPKLLDSDTKTFKLGMGEEDAFESVIPDGFQFTKPGIYEITFSTDNLSGKKTIVVFDPKIPIAKVSTKQKFNITDDPERPGIIKESVPASTKRQVEKKGIVETGGSTTSVDCPNMGEKCDDNNENTKGDIIRTNCKCQGILVDGIKTPYYLDLDGDGLGDPHSIQEVTEGTRPIGTWVKNADDKCPNRKGTIEGCPILHIESIKDQILIGKEVEVTADPNGLLQSDELKWSGKTAIKFLSNGDRSVNIICNEVGKFKIKYKVQNVEFPIDGLAEREILVKITTDQIRDIIQPIVVQGSAQGSGKFEQKSKAAMTELFRHTLSKRIKVFDELGIERDPLETFLVSDIKLGLPKNKHNIEITDISYDKATGKISELYIKFL